MNGKSRVTWAGTPSSRRGRRQPQTVKRGGSRRGPRHADRGIASWATGYAAGMPPDRRRKNTSRNGPSDRTRPSRRADRALDRGVAGPVAGRTRARARDHDGHPVRSRPDRVPRRGRVEIELVEPTDDTTGVARFLESKGEGFHHVCFEVPNLAEALLARDRWHRADRLGSAQGRRRPRRVPASTRVSRSPGRAHRGARGAVLGLARVYGAALPKLYTYPPLPSPPPGSVRLRRQKREHQGQLAGRAGGRTRVAPRPRPGSRPSTRGTGTRSGLDPEPRVDQRGDDLAQAMIPAMLGGSPTSASGSA